MQCWHASVFLSVSKLIYPLACDKIKNKHYYKYSSKIRWTVQQFEQQREIEKIYTNSRDSIAFIVNTVLPLSKEYICHRADLIYGALYVQS